MFLKGCLVPSCTNSFFFLFWPSLALSICYFFWINTFWGINLIYLEIEYNLVLLSLLSIFLNIVIFLTGYYSKNKYALLGSIRTLVVFFGMELLFGLFFLIVVCCSHSFHLSVIATV